MILRFVFTCWLLFLPLVARAEVIHPAKLEDCLEAPEVSKAASADLRMNPYYLRGDFDADHKPDFAVIVMGSKTKKSGVLFCLASGRRVILGGDGATSEEPLVAPNWEVATVDEILGFRKVNGQIPVPKGESILMVWEDGMHYIYWDGAKFCVSPTIQ